LALRLDEFRVDDHFDGYFGHRLLSDGSTELSVGGVTAWIVANGGDRRDAKAKTLLLQAAYECWQFRLDGL
jgi:hypothetical protein